MKKHILLILILIFDFCSFSFGQGSKYTGTYKNSSTILWNGLSGKTITGLSFENSTVYPIELINCSNITIENCHFENLKLVGIHLYNCNNITITNCTFDSVSSGVNACSCTGGIKFEYNDVQNVIGPMPRGQMIQFDEVNGAGNSISYNVCENELGKSLPEDAISLYKSNGLATDPIKIIGNWIHGGGPSNSGGGIMTGDNGGSYVVVQDNILVNPGQYGIAVASGHDITIQNNKVFSEKLAFSNVGIYAFNQYPSACGTITIANNSINFTYKTGIINNTYTDGTCGTITGWKTNIYDKTLNSSILPVKVLPRAKSISTGTVVPSTGIKKKIKVYPNPAKNLITIESGESVSDGIVTIYNMNGQKMIEQPFNNNSTQMNTNNLITGVYIVRITSSDGATNEQKLIIQK